MRSTVEPLEGNKVKLSVEVEAGEFEEAVDAAFKKIAKEVRLPGFRPGKAPRKVLEARLGHAGRPRAGAPGRAARVLRRGRHRARRRRHRPARDRHHRRPGGRATSPSTPSSRCGRASRCRATAACGSPSSARAWTRRSLDAQIDRMRELDSTLVEVGPARPGGRHRHHRHRRHARRRAPARASPPTTTATRSARVPSSPRSTSTSSGPRPATTLDFDAAHPDPDEARQLHFQVVVKEVKEKVLPEVTDEWAAEASEFETVAELRAEPGRAHDPGPQGAGPDGAAGEGGRGPRRARHDDIPEALVSQEMQERLQDLAMRLQAQGMQLEQYLAMTGADPETFSQELRDTATSGVKVDLALRAVADAEGIECTDEDLDEELDGGRRAGRPDRRRGAGALRARRPDLGGTLRHQEAQGARVAPRTSRGGRS